MYTGISIAVLSIEAILIALFGYLVFKKNALIHKKSLIYLLPVFLMTYVLYITATIYEKEEISFQALFLLIPDSLDMFKMDLKYSLVQDLCQENGWYNAAVILTCVFSLVTVIFSVLVIFGTTVSNGYKKQKFFSKGGDIVIGTSKSSLEYLRKHKDTLLWLEKGDKALYKNLIKEGYTVQQAPLNEKTLLKKLKDKEYHLIVFRDELTSYVPVLSTFEKLKLKSDKPLFLYLEANINEMSIVREKYLQNLQSKTNSFVIPFCRYELIARRFMTEHPITKYIPRAFFNKNLTLKEDKQINVVFLGLGKVNYELFKLASTSFQFAKEKNGKLVSAPVNYYIFERETDKFNNEYFIKILEEYPRLFKDSNLPRADEICHLERISSADAHSAETRKKLRGLVDENTFTYFIISLTEDFEDSAFAYNLQSCLEGESNYKIFVRYKGEDKALLEDGKENAANKEGTLKEDTDGKQDNANQNHIIYFGKTSDFLSRGNIINDDLMKLSKRINDLYNANTQNKFEVLREWQNLPVIEQYSNIHGAMHVYFKLYLLNCTLQKEKSGGLTKKDFESLYPDAFMKDKGKEYGYFFGTETANVLAFIEHSRWNAYYLMEGYKPLPFDEFSWKENEKGFLSLSHKNIARKRHACLTTYQGLDQLIRYKYDKTVAEIKQGKENIAEPDPNALAAIYRYDYMVIDGMYDALQNLEYSIFINQQNQA